MLTYVEMQFQTVVTCLADFSLNSNTIPFNPILKTKYFLYLNLTK